MLDTRSGFWTMASILLVSMATTGMVILFADQQDLTYRTFTAAISVPMSLILPIIAILSVTAEWSQRSGLTTFTLVPHRSRVIAGKLVASVAIALVATPVAFAIGAIGNLAGSVVAGVDPVWDMTTANLLTIELANLLGMMVGLMLGVLVRSSSAALVAYFLYQFLLPTLALVLAPPSRTGSANCSPWLDFDFATGCSARRTAVLPAVGTSRGHRAGLASRTARRGPTARGASRGQVGLVGHRTFFTGRMAAAPKSAQSPATAYSTW